MRTKLRFRKVSERDPTYHASKTSKLWIVRAVEVAKVFRRYSDKVNLKTPRYILHLMSQRNGCLLQLGEFASTLESDSTSPEFNLSPEMSSLGRRNPSIPSLKRIHLSFDDSWMSESLKTESSSTQQTLSVSPSKQVSSTISKAADLFPIPSTSKTATDLVPTSLVLSEECTSAESSSLSTVTEKIEKLKRDIDPICAQEYVDSSDTAKRAKKPDSRSPTKEFKMQLPPVRVEKEMPQPAKRLKRLKSVEDGSKFVSPVKKSKTSIHSTDDDKMDISPNKDIKMSDSPSKDCETIAVSPDKSESSEIVSPFSSIPIVEGDEIEMDFSCLSEDSPIPSYTTSLEEIENLVDDPSTAELIRKVVDDLINVSISLTETKGNFSPSKKSSIKIGSPSRPDTPPGLLSNPNVMAYLRLRFRSVLSHRKKCMVEIKSFYKLFRGDVRFLYSYSINILALVSEISIDKAPSRNAAILKDKMIKNATEISNRLSPLMNTVQSLLQFWIRSLKKIQKLNSKYKHFLSAEGCSITVDILREYESSLRIIWEDMDRKVLVEDDLIPSLLGITNDYLKLTKEFSLYLVTVNFLKPTLSAEEERRFRIRYPRE